MAGVHHAGDHAPSRIGDQRRPRVRDERQVLTGIEPREDRFEPLLLVVPVQRHEHGRGPDVVGEDPGASGVFGEDAGHRHEGLGGARREVRRGCRSAC